MTQSKKHAAVIPTRGIGDALLMMTSSHMLKHVGYEVTTYHDYLIELKPWFPGHLLKQKSHFEKDLNEISFDLVIAQNDNGPFIKMLHGLRKEKKIHQVSIFYPSYEANKHAPLESLDQVFNSGESMADNIALATSRLVHLNRVSKNNGISLPEDVEKGRFPKRVVIHPTSSEPEKNWPQKKFIALAKRLQEKGFSVLFAVSPSERTLWKDAEEEGIEVPTFPTLSDVAKAIAESGFLIGNDSSLGHLASNLHIPTLIIANCPRRMALWRPGWLSGQVVLPPRKVPNIKGLRLREKKWAYFVSVSRVFKAFEKLSNEFYR